MAPTPDNGMKHLSSPYSVPETLKRVKYLLQERGVTIFCVIDHSGEAAKIGLQNALDSALTREVPWVVRP